MRRRHALLLSCGLACLSAGAGVAFAADRPNPDTQGPDARALVIQHQLTPQEKLSLVHGIIAVPIFPGVIVPADAVPSAGYVPGVARLGLPPLKETDASLGVAYLSGLRRDGATALPSGLATASTWSPEIAYQGGQVAGQEAWRKGFNLLLGGGVDLARDPRNGRNFEYLGEDPLLAGTLAGEAIRGTQDQHVVSTVKHYALNDQETGRNVLSAEIAESAARESDLLAFEIAIEHGRPGSVMCSYNRYGGVYACENDFLLNRVLKHDWAYPGWVMSDWGAVHSVKSALNGLDQESGEQVDSQVYFNKPLLAAVSSDPAYAARLEDMDHRIIRSLYAVGAVDHPPQTTALDMTAGAAVALRAAQQGIVLLRNTGGLLPLAAGAKSIAVIGGHADLGVISGGGSSQVAPPGGPALIEALGGEGPLAFIRNIFFMPSSPIKAIRAAAPSASVRFDDGRYPAAAAALAKRSDIAIVFATQWMSEAFDAPDLSLPQGQDQLIAAVAAANPHTIVVLETGGPVLMPWLAQVPAVVEAWYPGQKGGEAIARVLAGEVDAAGRLPMSFPQSLDQLPRPKLDGEGIRETLDMSGGVPFDVTYGEGAEVGYRWYEKQGLRPLFPFGWGLSYTAFSHEGLAARGGRTLTVSFRIANVGRREGTDVAQVYAAAPGQTRRLIGWGRVSLQPGQSRTMTVIADRRLLARFDTAANRWRVPAGRYQVTLSRFAGDPDARTVSAEIEAATLEP